MVTKQNIRHTKGVSFFLGEKMKIETDKENIILIPENDEDVF